MSWPKIQGPQIHAMFSTGMFISQINYDNLAYSQQGIPSILTGNNIQLNKWNLIILGPKITSTITLIWSEESNASLFGQHILPHDSQWSLTTPSRTGRRQKGGELHSLQTNHHTPWAWSVQLTHQDQLLDPLIKFFILKYS